MPRGKIAAMLAEFTKREKIVLVDLMRPSVVCPDCRIRCVPRPFCIAFWSSHEYTTRRGVEIVSPSNSATQTARLG